MGVQEVKLRCAFCQDEFQDYDQRVKHYRAHVLGELPIPEVTTTFSCTLCGAEFDSVEERRSHYKTCHCQNPRISSLSTDSQSFKEKTFSIISKLCEEETPSRISCRDASCPSTFQSVAVMMNHYFRHHKLKNP